MKKDLHQEEDPVHVRRNSNGGLGLITGREIKIFKFNALKMSKYVSWQIFFVKIIFVMVFQIVEFCKNIILIKPCVKIN